MVLAEHLLGTMGYQLKDVVVAVGFLHLRGTGAGCTSICWFTITWFTYGVGGILVWGARGYGMWVALPNVCGLSESSIRFNDGLKSA